MWLKLFVVNIWYNVFLKVTMRCYLKYRYIDEAFVAERIESSTAVKVKNKLSMYKIEH